MLDDIDPRISDLGEDVVPGRFILHGLRDDRAGSGRSARPPELTQRAAVEGTVPVIVHLAMAVTPEGVLADESAVLDSARVSRTLNVPFSLHSPGREFGCATGTKPCRSSLSSRSRGARYPRYLDGNGPPSGRGRAGASSARPERSARSRQRSMGYGLHRQRQGDCGPGLRYRQSSSLLGWQGLGGGMLLRQQQLPEWLEDPAAGRRGCPLHLDAPSDCEHGTHIAGIAAGTGASFSGVAKDARLMSVQVFSRFTGMPCIGGEDPCALSFASDQLALGSNASIRYGTSTPPPPST